MNSSIKPLRGQSIGDINLELNPLKLLYSERALPDDSVLLPLLEGHLLVSKRWATYCRVSTDESAEIEKTLRTRRTEALSVMLIERLEAHGFFSPPQEPLPIRPSVQFQLTNACNLACTYCCTNSGTARARELDRERWFSLASEVSEVMGSSTSVALLGGEPLLVPWCLDLADAILDHGLHLTLFSNGIPLREPQLARRTSDLIARGAEVRISLAGPTANTCDGESKAIRFTQTMEALDALAQHGQRAIVDLMLTPQNAGSIAQYMPELRKRLPPETRVAFGIIYHGGREQGEHLFADQASLEAALDRITFEAGEIIEATQPSPKTHRREGCTCTRGDHLNVRSDGRLFTCFRMEECIGDLATESFAAAFARAKHRPSPASSLPFCAACPLATLCGGGCRAENLQITGDADTPACGPWRIQVISELLAEDRPSALEWPVHLLLAECHRRGIHAPEQLHRARTSRHLTDT